jgi:hypothetical protein
MWKICRILGYKQTKMTQMTKLQKEQLVKSKILNELEKHLVKLKYETGQKWTIHNFVNEYIDRFLTQYNRQ